MTPDSAPAEPPDHDIDRWHDDGGAVPPDQDDDREGRPREP